MHRFVFQSGASFYRFGADVDLMNVSFAGEILSSGTQGPAAFHSLKT